MGVPVKFFTFVDSQADAGKLTAARLNGDFDPLYASLDPATGGLEDTNVKAGAKIVCTDRVHTITAAWTFSVVPTISGMMLKSVYDTNDDGQVGDADMVDGEHAAAFADASHNHAGADINSGSLDGDRLAAPTTTKRGGVKATGTPSGKFLKDDDTWSFTGGIALAVVSAALVTPTDSYTYYFGGVADVPDAGGQADRRRLYVPKAGTIMAAYIFWYAETAGTGENVSVYIRLNNTSDTLIATIGNTAATKVFSKTDLSIAVAQGDYIEIKMVCPAWATNPATVHLGGSIYIE